MLTIRPVNIFFLIYNTKEADTEEKGLKQMRYQEEQEAKPLGHTDSVLFLQKNMQVGMTLTFQV